MNEPVLQLQRRTRQIGAAPPSRGYLLRRSRPCKAMPQPGETVLVAVEHWRGAGYRPRTARIRRSARACGRWNPQEIIDRDFFARKIKRAFELRKQVVFPQERPALYRLIHGESDGLPGLIVDRYNDTLVLQMTTAGHRISSTARLWTFSSHQRLRQRIYERSDVDVRELEGLHPVKGLLRGAPLRTDRC